MHHAACQPTIGGLRRRRHLRQPPAMFQAHMTTHSARWRTGFALRRNRLRFCLHLRSRYTRADSTTTT